MKISEINIVPVKPTNGLVAFASCVIDEQLYIGSLGVHKKLDGSGYRITYPTQKLGAGQLSYYHPITKEAGRQIAGAITSRCRQLLQGSSEYGRHGQDTTTYS